MIGLCLAAGLVSASIHTESFTLAWMHSIEKIRWEEDWRIDNGKLVIDEARIRGTGAGMEPPDGAKLIDGVWHYRPNTAPLVDVALAHSPYTRGYEICVDQHCRPLAEHLPGLAETAVIHLRACP